MSATPHDGSPEATLVGPPDARSIARWLVRPRPQPLARARLICVPHAGAGASAFARWVALLPETIDVVCVQPPGRESRLSEPSMTNTEALAKALAGVLAPLLDRPYALIGHSFGAMVAYETTRALRASGHPEPVCLFASASRPPHEPWPHPSVQHLDDWALSRELDRRYGTAVPAEVMDSPELRAVFIPPLRADLAAVESYVHVPQEPLTCAVSAFAGASDPMAPTSTVEAWRQATSGPFTFRVIEGGHFFIKTAIAHVVAAVEQDLLGRLALGEARSGHGASSA